MSTQAGDVQPGDSSGLLEALRVLRERWLLVIAAVVICTGAPLALALSQEKSYRASATVLVKTTGLTTLIDPTQAQSQDPARQQGDNLTLARSLAVADRVRTELGLRTTLDALRSNLDAAAVPDTDLITISYTDTGNVRAAAVANAFADQLVAYLGASVQAQIAQGQAAISAQLAQLPPADPSRAELSQALSRVTALRAASSGNAQVIDRAEVPHSPSGPRVKRDALIGALVGIVLGLALAFLVDLLDRRVKDIEDFQRLYGRAPLASIALQRKPSARNRPAELEPFRILHAGLDFVSLRAHVQVTLVSSAVPSEGKTFVAAGLARAAASVGRRVALVEVDLHRPTVARVMGLEPYPHGLTSVLSENVTLSEAVRPCLEETNLTVLTSGPLTTNAAALLDSPAMDNLLTDLRRDYDFIVLDSPPLLHVSDAQVLMDSPHVDVVLVVARPFVTTREQVRASRAVLDRHAGASVGLVVNGVRDRTGSYYYSSGDDHPTSGSRFGIRRKEGVT